MDTAPKNNKMIIYVRFTDIVEEFHIPANIPLKSIKDNTSQKWGAWSWYYNNNVLTYFDAEMNFHEIKTLNATTSDYDLLEIYEIKNGVKIIQ